MRREEKISELYSPVAPLERPKVLLLRLVAGQFEGVRRRVHGKESSVETADFRHGARYHLVRLLEVVGQVHQTVLVLYLFCIWNRG